MGAETHQRARGWRRWVQKHIREPALLQKARAAAEARAATLGTPRLERKLLSGQCLPPSESVALAALQGAALPDDGAFFDAPTPLVAPPPAVVVPSPPSASGDELSDGEAAEGEYSYSYSAEYSYSYSGYYSDEEPAAPAAPAASGVPRAGSSRPSTGRKSTPGVRRPPEPHGSGRPPGPACSPAAACSGDRLVRLLQLRVVLVLGIGGL